MNTADLPLRSSRLVLPPVVLLGGFLAASVIVGPIIALFLRVPWSRLVEVGSAPETHELLRVTLSSALLSMVITTLLGVPLALWLRSLQRGAGVIRLLVILPLALPPVVSGLALSAALGRRGITAPLLNSLGWQFSFAFSGVVVSHVFISLPFVVVAVDQALRHLDQEIISSAAGLGLRPTTLVFRIILPAVAPAIITGAGLALGRSLGEFGTTLTFAGSLPGVTRTMPLGIYLDREIDPDRALVLALFLVALATAVLAITGAISLLLRRQHPLSKATTIGEHFDVAALRTYSAPMNGGATITVQRGELQAHVPANSTTAIVGPNGAGKTTLAHLISGRMRGALVRIDDHTVDGNTFVPAHQRGVVLLSQRHGLPPHMTVHQAVAMIAHTSSVASELIRAAGLETIEHAKISSLSGGQAAQVALVRALASRPRTLILDEPFAALDVAAAQRWREFFRASVGDRTTILISHNPLEIASLAKPVVVLDHGKTIVQGSVDDVFAAPPNDFVAQLSGINRISGTVVHIDDDVITLHAGSEIIYGIAQDSNIAVGSQALCIFDPQATSIRLPDHFKVEESTKNLWNGIIRSIESFGTVTEVHIETCGTIVRVPITTTSAARLELDVSDRVIVATKTLAISIHPTVRCN
ncbi:MAG: ATP-binding cassette domain-containing protein [Corynebacterium sp.]|nr:ATP-binding cassette domain-containing protein [Corynebacterium sp.]